MQAACASTLRRGSLPIVRTAHPPCSDLHVTEGWRIAAPYRTGVATSGKGILLHPRAALGAFNLSDFGEAPGGAHFVDDIWLNGHLALAGVPRWVVPLPGEPADLQVRCGGLRMRGLLGAGRQRALRAARVCACMQGC